MGYKTLFEQIKTVCAWNSLRQRLLGLTPLSVTNSDIAQSNYLHSMYIGNISLANKNDQL